MKPRETLPPPKEPEADRRARAAFEAGEQRHREYLATLNPRDRALLEMAG